MEGGTRVATLHFLPDMGRWAGFFMMKGLPEEGAAEEEEEEKELLGAERCWGAAEPDEGRCAGFFAM